MIISWGEFPVRWAKSFVERIYHQFWSSHKSLASLAHVIVDVVVVRGRLVSRYDHGRGSNSP
jgi:hypothetical protein